MWLAQYTAVRLSIVEREKAHKGREDKREIWRQVKQCSTDAVVTFMDIPKLILLYLCKRFM